MTAATDTPRNGLAGISLVVRQLPAPAIVVLAGVLVNRLASFLQAFLVLFVTHRGFSESQGGVALGCFGAGSLIGVLIGGAVADRLGVRIATVVSTVGSAVLLVVLLAAPTFPALLVTVLAVGLVGQFYRPAAATLLAGCAPPDRQLMVFALYRWMLNIGTTLAPLVAAVLITVSYDLLFWAEGLAALLYGVVAVTLLPRRPSVAACVDSPPDPPQLRAGYAAVLGDRRFLLYLLAMLANSMVYVQYVSSLPLAMRDAGLGTGWYGVVIALNAALVVGCELLVTSYTQRFAMRLLVAGGFALLGIGFALYAVPWGIAGVLIATVIWTAAEIVGGPAMFAYPGTATPPQLRGRSIAATQTAFSLGAAIGPVAGVAAWGAFGSGLWWCCGLVCLAGLGLALAGMRSTPPASTATATATAATGAEEKEISE